MNAPSGDRGVTRIASYNAGEQKEYFRRQTAFSSWSEFPVYPGKNEHKLVRLQTTTDSRPGSM